MRIDEKTLFIPCTPYTFLNLGYFCKVNPLKNFLIMKLNLTFLLVIIFLPLSLFAQWSTNPAVNNVICNLSGEQAIPKVATCSNGDTYVGYFSNEAGNYDVRLQRLDVQGNLLWAANGIMISSNPQQTWLTDWDMTCDVANHCILAFNDIRTGNSNIVTYRISPSGSFVWGTNGILLSNTSAFNAAPKVVSTAAGNAVVAWQADNVCIMQKITPAGTLLWGTNGITLTSTNRMAWPQLLPVGTDEIIMKYFDDAGSTMYPTRHVFAQKYNASGVAMWSSPAAISTAGGISSWTQIFPFINDGNDGFYIAWHDDRNNDTRASVFVQHIGSTGTVLYPANGVEASNASSMNHFYAKLALPTGSSDVFVYWNEMNNNQDQWGIFGQKINSAGVVQWPAGGMSFIPVSTTNVYPYEARKSPTDMVVFYEEYSGSINGLIKAMRISTTGTFLWTPAQKTMCSVLSEKIHPVVNEFANNQWIASWEDKRNGNTDIYAQNIQLNGDLGPVNLTTGTISGTITLGGGTGNVTQAVVTAGTYTTNPDASGHYSMLVSTGTYTVSASLSGYYPASQSNVVVNTNQTTTVNLTLNHIPAGIIEGNVTLVGGTGIITSVLVNAGTQATSPNSAGHYSLSVTPGTYSVIATLPAYIPDTVFNVSVADAQTVTGINLTLDLAPTNGLITGTVSLNGGSGNVTQADVYAGGVTVHPNVSGFYTLDLPAGNYDVICSLAGYVTQMQISVPVVVGQTTANINFTLVPSANAGNITGHVTITGEPADVTLTDVSAGGYATHPDAAGNYNLAIPAGTYSVTAVHPYTNSVTNPNVLVVASQTTTGVNFTLTVNRADMICKAIDQWGGFVNPTSLVIEGPEGPYTGTITNDSLIFLHVPYGTFNGTANWVMYGPSYCDTVIDATNHYMVFHFVITGINNRSHTTGLKVNPNPAGPQSRISFSLASAGKVTFDLIDMQGRIVSTLILRNPAIGEQSVALGELTGNKSLTGGVYHLRMYGEDHELGSCRILFEGKY